MPLSEVENVILIGMMGSGKSTLGKQLARRLRRPFVDSDTEVTRRAGVDIPLIFDLEGESGFRARETEAIADLLVKQTGIVLATGGGAVVRAENRALLRNSGLVVYLHAAVGVLHERTRHAKGRPLLAVEDPVQRLTELYSARDPLYRATAHLVVESDQSRVSALLNRVVQGLEKLSRHPPLRDLR